MEEWLLIWNAERRKRGGDHKEKINCGGFNSGVQEKKDINWECGELK